MNREIKFKGKRIDNKEWVYGYFMIGLNGLSYIINKRLVEENTNFLDYSIVFEESVGQFTGLKDKNGMDIYEGDIVVKISEDWSVTVDWDDEDERWGKPIPVTEQNRDVVDLSRFGFWLKNESFGYEGEDLQQPGYYEIIGNIHDNPELKP